MEEAESTVGIGWSVVVGVVSIAGVARLAGMVVESEEGIVMEEEAGVVFKEVPSAEEGAVVDIVGVCSEDPATGV